MKPLKFVQEEEERLKEYKETWIKFMRIERAFAKIRERVQKTGLTLELEKELKAELKKEEENK